MGQLILADHFSPEYEPVILKLAGLAVPAQPRDYRDRFRGNDFFLMATFDPGIVAKPPQRGQTAPQKRSEAKKEPPARIRQNTPVSRVLLEVLRAVDDDIKRQSELTHSYLSAEQVAITEQVVDTAAVKTTLGASNDLDRLFGDFSEFMEDRHGLDFQDLVNRTHQFGRIVVYRALLHTNPQQADLSAAS